MTTANLQQQSLPEPDVPVQFTAESMQKYLLFYKRNNFFPGKLNEVDAIKQVVPLLRQAEVGLHFQHCTFWNNLACLGQTGETIS